MQRADISPRADLAASELSQIGPVPVWTWRFRERGTATS